MDNRSNFQLKYNEYKNTLEELQEKVIQLTHDKDEHEAVLKTLVGAEPTRKCYRMVGSSLVESDVKSTIPILETNSKKLTKTVSIMKSELVKTGQEFEKWKKDNKIQVVRQ